MLRRPLFWLLLNLMKKRQLVRIVALIGALVIILTAILPAFAGF